MSTKALFLDRTSDNALVRAIRELLEAPTTEAMHAVLVREQALLLTEAAINMLEALFKDEMLESPKENVYGPMYIAWHKTLLLACHSLGLSAGWQDWLSKSSGMASREATREHYRTSTFNQSILWKQDPPSSAWNPGQAAPEWIKSLATIALASVHFARTNPGSSNDGALGSFVDTTVAWSASAREFMIGKTSGVISVARSEDAASTLLQAWVEELEALRKRDQERFIKATYFIDGPALALAKSALPQ